MTSEGRTVIAVVALVLGTVLVVMGAIQGAPESTTAGASAISLVLGYVFGDRNGEKRLAAALTVLDAQQRQAEAGQTVPPVVVTPTT